MRQVDAQDVIDRLGRQIGELAVRLAVADARLAALTEPPGSDGTGAADEG